MTHGQLDTNPAPGVSGAAPTRRLVATYRLQARGEMDLVGAAAVLPYLADLGVSHAYLSPVLQAREGSTHGYDVVDPHRADEALGGDEAFVAFARAAHGTDLGVVLDIVPNHMAADPDRNRWWRDVLANGRASAYAHHFDITWDPPDRKLSNQVLLPVLGDHYGRVLGRGELVLEREDAYLQVRYFERTFPLDLASVAWLYRGAATTSDNAQLELVARLLERLVSPTEIDAGPGVFAQRRADVALAQRALAEAVTDDAVQAALDDEVRAVNEDRDALHAILDRQNYRLARWQTGSQEIDYRRFFDITDLVGVRVEAPSVFADTHERIAAWVRDGLVDGLRVDHPDGLADPERYCADLRALADDRWIVVEKILEHGEELPPWPVDGTTGYEFAATVNRLFVARDGHRAMTETTADLTGIDLDFATLVREAKLDALRNELAAELRRLTDRLVAVCERHPDYRDFARRELQEALATALACLPVYRSYVTQDGVASAQDRAVLDTMVTEARKTRPDLEADLFTLLQHALVGSAPFSGAPAAALRQRFQQLSGAVMAKGKEDTALYRYPVLLATNEVGADPSHPATSVDEVHAFFGGLATHRPHGMLTLSTHDTKRSDDVRARLDVLSEIPDRYDAALRAFVERHQDWGAIDADPSLLVVLFQTLVGAHPISPERMVRYAEKAVREAGRRTSWLQPDPQYEDAMRDIVQRAMTDEWSRSLVEELATDTLVDGRVNALAQRLLLLTAPGVPDLYQGSELWDLSLVDPDNRRPVDFARRRSLLAEGGWDDPAVALPDVGVLADPDDPGTLKLALTMRALAVRRAHPASFDEGSYQPLLASGTGREHVFAYRRGDDVLVAIPRLVRTLHAAHGGWGDTALDLPAGDWSDALMPERVVRGTVTPPELFGELPVALLCRRTD